MSPRRRLTLLLSLPLAGFAILLTMLWGGLGKDPSLLPSALLDRPLPAFSAARLDDPQQTVEHTDLRGEIALLNVWATWCPTCYAEHTFLNSLKERGVVIYGINYKDERAKALDWLTQLGDPYRINIDDSAGQLGIDLGVYGAPETFLLDTNGVIRYRHVGAVDEQVWQNEFLPRIRTLEGQS
jgi:cytochrome c biogenesis protein CcmG, thiol:disulfide interchange protein DsbE